MTEYKYHYVYKTTNIVNGKYYYGMHSTNNLHDGYKGSGHALHKALKKYGPSNFRKEIISFFKTREEASAFEKELVDSSVVRDNMCYNMRTGGDYGKTVGSLLLRDANDVIRKFDSDSDEITNGSYTNPMCGRVFVRRVSDNKEMIVTLDDFYLNRKLYITPTQGKSAYIDSDGNTCVMSKDDVRVKSGEFKPIWFGRKHKEETKQKIRNRHKETHHQSGARNSQYGKCWITKDGVNKSIKKACLDEYIADGWVCGRHVLGNRRSQNKLNVEDVQQYINQGYKRKDICDVFGVSRDTLRRFMTNNNIL